MLKFTINAKELKNLVNCVATAIDKKSYMLPLRAIYFQIDESGKLKIFGTNIEQWLEVRTDLIWDTEPGVFGIDNDDMKIILKMSESINFEDITKDKDEKIAVKCGKRELTVEKVNNIDFFLPSMDNTEEIVLETTEFWMYNTISSLANFTANRDNSNMLMHCINFNTKKERVTSLDGHRMAMRKIKGQKICSTYEHINVNADFAVPVLKAVLDKKNNDNKKALLSVDKKWIKISGLDFTYMIKKTDGEYFKVDQIIPDCDDYSFKANTEKLLDTMKYNADLINKEKVAVVFHPVDEKLYSYTKVPKYEVCEELEVQNLKMNAELYIAFNPHYWVDALSMADTDEVEICGKNAVSPVMIYGNEYSFLILPVHINTVSFIDNMKKRLDRVV